MWGNVMLSRTEEVPLFKRTGPMGSGGKTCIPFRVRYEGLAAAGDPITSGDEELKQPKAKTEKELRGIEREEETKKEPKCDKPIESSNQSCYRQLHKATSKRIGDGPTRGVADTRHKQAIPCVPCG